jgi:diaminopimelate epimerase
VKSKLVSFVKMVASGNDFIVIEKKILPVPEKLLKFFSGKICDRKYGIGADGLLLLEQCKSADVRMRIFNADGSEAEMCGNGARCVAVYVNAMHKPAGPLRIMTKSGLILSTVKDTLATIKLTDPKAITLDIPLRVSGRLIRGHFINTGVPHCVIFVDGLNGLDVVSLGRAIRRHPRFKPAGTNVDFVESLSADSIKVRTYERGVEDETLACGTGSVASALIFALKAPGRDSIAVQTRSGEVLRVSFKQTKNGFRDCFLEGRASPVFRGTFLIAEGGQNI